MNFFLSFLNGLLPKGLPNKLILIYILFAFSNIVLFVVLKYVESGFYNKDICFSFSCFSYLFSAFNGVISVIEFYVENLFYLVSMVSLYVATQHYIRSNISSNMSTHISNANTFKEHIEQEVVRSNIIGLKSIDPFKWYNIIYPDSRGGDLLVSLAYIKKIKNISEIIDESNKGKRLDYKEHQSKMINALRQIGIDIGRAPRNNFNETEQYVLSLINKINKDFCFITNQVSIVEPEYY